MIENKLISIENFNEFETEYFIKIINEIFKDKCVFLYRPSIYRNILNRAGYKSLSEISLMLIELAELNQFYLDEIKKYNDKLIFTENYYYSLMLNLSSINFVNNIKKTWKTFQFKPSDLTIIKYSDDKKEQINNLALKYPHQCKVIKEVNKQEIIKNILFYMKQIKKNN